MKRSPLFLVALLAGIIALAGCRQETPVETTAEPAAPGALEVPPAMTAEPEAPSAQVTRVEVGTQLDDDGAVAEAQTGLSSDDATIFATVTTTSEADIPAGGNLAARWTYQDGQLVDERSVALSFTGEDTTTFRIDNDEGWPAGSYTVEIILDGEVVETREFTIG
ncbi:MAG: hypothetical protein ACTHZI_00840 [Luteimonas sp.]